MVFFDKNDSGVDKHDGLEVDTRIALSLLRSANSQSKVAISMRTELFSVHVNVRG